MPADTTQTRVFIVEDERNLADLYEMWLEDEYDVRTAYSGEAALEHITDREPDVVVLDRRMPGLSGDDVADRLDKQGCDAQVIMVTAVSPSPEVASLPIDDYITKPIRKERLHSLVETAALVRTYDDDITELLALTARQQALVEAVPADELGTSEEFGQLMTRIEDVQGSIDDTIVNLWSQSNTNVFARVAGQIER